MRMTLNTLKQQIETILEIDDRAGDREIYLNVHDNKAGWTKFIPITSLSYPPLDLDIKKVPRAQSASIFMKNHFISTGEQNVGV